MKKTIVFILLLLMVLGTGTFIFPNPGVLPMEYILVYYAILAIPYAPFKKGGWMIILGPTIVFLLTFPLPLNIYTPLFLFPIPEFFVFPYLLFLLPFYALISPPRN